MNVKWTYKEKTSPQSIINVSKTIFVFSVSVGQESRRCLAGWFLLRVSHASPVKLLAQTAVISRLNRGWQLCLHSHGCWQALEDPLPSPLMSLLAGLGSSPHGPLYRFLSVLTVSNWWSEREPDRAQDGTSSLYNWFHMWHPSLVLFYICYNT